MIKNLIVVEQKMCFLIKEDGCDYVVRDVDMLPQDDCDYSHGDTPKHVSYLSQWDYTLRDIHYFGGVVIFTIEQFENVNGYLTDWWGWGLRMMIILRCIQKGYLKLGILNQEVQEFYNLILEAHIKYQLQIV